MRQAEIVRETKETRIRVSVDLEGSGEAEISTGIGFFDHMLTHLAKHGRFDLQVAGVDGTPQRGTLDLGGHGRAHRLRLDQRELVELLFGCLPVDERFGAHAGISDSARRILAVILPLPLHIPSLNHI